MVVVVVVVVEVVVVVVVVAMSKKLAYLIRDETKRGVINYVIRLNFYDRLSMSCTQIAQNHPAALRL